MPGKLSTHVLDTCHGRPAGQVAIDLYRLTPGGESLLGSFTTNEDGRTDNLLLDHESLVTGTYRLLFKIGPYFRSQGVELPDPSFLEDVSVDVNLESGQSYHVPLLASPWSYSTYRGS